MLAIHQYERRPGAGIFLGWDCGGHHYGAFAQSLAFCDRAEFCFTYKGRAVDVKQVARELGVRYVVEGSVRRSGDRVRVTAQLIDAETGKHIWADRYDRSLQDAFAVQDEITKRSPRQFYLPFRVLSGFARPTQSA